MSMSIQDKIMLLTTGYTTIVVNFPGSTGDYTYKAMVDEGIQAGDAVVVNSPSKGLTVVTVKEVHAVPNIDVNANFRLQWIVQRVDTTKYKKRLEMEDRLSETLLNVEREKQRATLAQDVQSVLGAEYATNLVKWVQENMA